MNNQINVDITLNSITLNLRWYLTHVVRRLILNMNKFKIMWFLVKKSKIKAA
jgi:hypothetical protein